MVPLEFGRPMRAPLALAERRGLPPQFGFGATSSTCLIRE